MNALASRYQTRNTLFPWSTSEFAQVLPADPRRWYVEFKGWSAGGGPIMIMPEPYKPDPRASYILPQIFAWKFNDCPSIVTGAFWGKPLLNDELTNYMLITECLYIG